MREWRRLVRQGWAMENFATVRLIAEKLDQTHLNDLTRMHLDPEVSHYLGGVRLRILT
jgi:hypothetical protein